VSDYSDLAKLLKRFSLLEAFLLSFFALPFVIQAWITALEKLAFSQCVQRWLVAGVFVLYIIGAAAMVISNNASKRKEVAKDQVLSYLQSKSLTFASFERIQERVNGGYSNELLESLPAAFPQEVRCAKLKSGRRGIGRIVLEESDDV
jgi:hypothetical protein